MFDGQKIVELGTIADQLHILQVNCILIKQFIANPHVRIYMQSSHDDTKSNVMWLALYDHRCMDNSSNNTQETYIFLMSTTFINYQCERRNDELVSEI